MASGVERRMFIVMMAAVILLDRITKIFFEQWLMTTGPVSVIGEFFHWRLVYNRGAAFGMGSSSDFSRWIFFAIAIVAVIVLYRMSREADASDRLRQASLGAIAGGAAGNMIDRIVSPRGVVDFIDFDFGFYHFPTFNVADIAITCGAVALGWSLWQEERRRAVVAG
jgi:signal peptidase II